MRDLALLAVIGFAGCVEAAAPSDEPTAPNQLRDDDKSDDGGPLWAGLSSVTIARYASDPCNDGQWVLGDEPIAYDDWARQRATIRNVCFEVWKPGVTDTDNPDFWKLLDVQVHFRFGTGEYQHAYVNSIDRRGNNRRYAWALDFNLDPFGFARSVPTIPVPFQIVSETAEWARVTADLEFYFTVNGAVLKSPANRPFVIRYHGYAHKPMLAASATGYVLHDLVTCGNGAARFGSGAGFFAADIRDAAAITALGGGLDGSLIYGVPVARASQIMSMTYGTQTTVANEALPGFSDSGGIRIRPDGSSMIVELDVYDRALGATRKLAHAFTGCAAR